MLQVCVSAVCGHALPPFVGGVLVRLRDWMPLPHDFVQVNQVSHVPTSQLTGHAWLLQPCVSSVCGQALPPNVGEVYARERDCEPPPQDLVQVDQTENVGSMVQSTGHECVLHDRESSAVGHASPPRVGWVKVRMRVCVPWPHERSQVPQAPQALMTQFTGHAWTLQNLVSSACGHTLPPSVGCVMVARVRDCEPPPHDLVQEVQLSVKAT
jgi:hypothetical protein